MRRRRRGIVLPAVLAAIVALGLLAALALHDAVQAWRVAALADDALLAQAALLEGEGAVADPPDLPGLCQAAPLHEQSDAAPAAGGGRWTIRWRHAGGGVVRAEVEGAGRAGTRRRAIALVRPDSVVRVAGVATCAAATRLVGVGPGWLEGHPEG